METNRSTVYFFSFLLAFCSLFYELVYAHILSVCVGGTKTQYLLIISLFTCALGIGSLLQHKLAERFTLRRLFFAVELSLTVLGSLGPFLIAWVLQVEPEPAALTTAKLALSYFLVFLIGLLSGFEIPCLFALAPEAHGKVLGFDYAGMLAASILFPFLFLPVLGTASSTLVIAALNLHALIWLLPASASKRVKLVLHGATFVLICALVGLRSPLNEVLSSLYLGGI